MTWYKIKTPKMKMYKSFKEYRPVQPNMEFCLWIFQNLEIATLILREMNFG